MRSQDSPYTISSQLKLSLQIKKIVLKMQHLPQIMPIIHIGRHRSFFYKKKGRKYMHPFLTNGISSRIYFLTLET